MKKLIIAVLAVASFAAVFSMGANYIVNGGKGVALAAEELKASGIVESVDAEKGELVVKVKDAKDELALGAKADMLKGLKKGDKVKVQYLKGDKNTATYIRKMGKMVIVGC